MNYTRRDGPQPAVPAPGPGAPWLPAPIPHQGPWQGRAQPWPRHGKPAEGPAWHPRHNGHACAPGGALMSPLLPAVVILRRVILAAEPAATYPWPHGLDWYRQDAIEAGDPS